MTDNEKLIESAQSSFVSDETAEKEAFKMDLEASNIVLNVRRMAEICTADIARQYCDRWDLTRLDSLNSYIIENDRSRIEHMQPGWANNLKLHEYESRGRVLDSKLAESETYNEGMQTLLQLWSRVTNLHPKHLMWIHFQEENNGYVYVQSLFNTLMELERFRDFRKSEHRVMHYKMLQNLVFGAQTAQEESLFYKFRGLKANTLPPEILR